MKNTKAKKAMKAAWTNWKAGRYTSWSECLKSAWKWVKSLDRPITIFIDHGYKMTDKAIFTNGSWYPLSLVELNVSCNTLINFTVPFWFYRQKKSHLFANS